METGKRIPPQPLHGRKLTGFAVLTGVIVRIGVTQRRRFTGERQSECTLQRISTVDLIPEITELLSG